MKLKKETFLQLHERLLKNGAKMPLLNDISFTLMKPTKSDYRQLRKEDSCTTYWASGGNYQVGYHEYTYTPLRQNIILFCAAMNGEL